METDAHITGEMIKSITRKRIGFAAPFITQNRKSKLLSLANGTKNTGEGVFMQSRMTILQKTKGINGRSMACCTVLLKAKTIGISDTSNLPKALGIMQPIHFETCDCTAYGHVVV
jgi:hypothetical protein